MTRLVRKCNTESETVNPSLRRARAQHRRFVVQACQEHSVISQLAWTEEQVGAHSQKNNRVSYLQGALIRIVRSRVVIKRYDLICFSVYDLNFVFDHKHGAKKYLCFQFLCRAK